MTSPHSVLLLCLIRRNVETKRIRFSKTFSLLAKRRRDLRIPRIALQFPSMSAFATLFGSGNDQALITLTGFDFSTFYHMLSSFAPLYETYSSYSSDGYIRKLPSRVIARGRPRSMSSEQCLGLVLTWTRTRGSEMVLCMLFGITGSVCSMFLRFGRRLLLGVLSRDPQARVRMPSPAERTPLNSAITERYSMLQHVYCVADGLKIYLEQSGDSVIQNMFYNGWTHDHYVGDVFVFAPNGLIIACAVNAPGAMHDSAIADWGGVYHKLEMAYNACRGRCVVDSSFAKIAFPFLIKTSQDPLDSSQGDPVVLSTLRQATSMRQASEWGMRVLKGTFPRLKDRAAYEETGERKVMLMVIVLLFNIRTRLVGLNQILNTFMPHLSVEANCFLTNNIGI